MILIGIDTALRSTGYGVIRVEGKGFEAIDCGVITNSKKDSHSECLRRVAGGTREIVNKFKPEVAAIEGGFFYRNAKTAMVLGMARGAVVSVLAEFSLPIYEYAPRRVKQAVTGTGAAEKSRIADVVAKMLNLNLSLIPDDATDALAIALCHAMTGHAAGGIHLPEPL